MKVSVIEQLLLREKHAQQMCRELYEKTSWISGKLQKDEYKDKTADYWYRKLLFFAKPVTREILIKAVRYRIDNKKQNLSFFDCVGYMFAMENNMDFVTGDREFQGKDGVEFLK